MERKGLPAAAGPVRSQGSGAKDRKVRQASCDLQFGKPLAEDFEGAAAVADAVLDRGVEFGGGEVVFRVKKDRVVAEAVFAAWCAEDAALPAAFGNQRLRVIGVAQ